MRTRHTLARAVSCVNEADLFEQSDQIPPDCSRSDSSSCLISGRFRKSMRALVGPLLESLFRRLVQLFVRLSQPAEKTENK